MQDCQGWGGQAGGISARLRGPKSTFGFSLWHLRGSNAILQLAIAGLHLSCKALSEFSFLQNAERVPP